MFRAEYFAEVAEKAVQVLDEKGHIRGDYENKRGVCALGAIRIAAHGSISPLGVREVEAEIAHAAGLPNAGLLIDWNDMPYTAKNGKVRYRDKRDVQRLLKRAARNLRKQAAADGSAVSTA
jgi:hypothetical protein